VCATHSMARKPKARLECCCVWDEKARRWRDVQTGRFVMGLEEDVNGFNERQTRR
jgi:hypothetical protein